MSELLHEVNASVEPGTPATPLAPTIVASVLTTQPWPIRQKRISTSWSASHIGYNSESILSRNDTPLGYLHLALAYRYHFVWRKREDISLCTDSKVNTNYERIASWSGYQCWTRDPRILMTPLASHCCSQCLNQPAMTHPFKTDWHQLSGVTHWLQQRVDSEQERFSTGLLTPGTGV